MARVRPGYGTPVDRLALAAAELVRVRHPDGHHRFVRALLASARLEEADFREHTTIEVAGRVAGIDPELLSEARLVEEAVPLLNATEAEARELGVKLTPSLYRAGPAMRVRLTDPAERGGALRRLQTIDAVLDDDALWGLSKP